MLEEILQKLDVDDTNGFSTTWQKVKVIFNNLCKVHQKMDENMRVLGTHKKDPMAHIKVAIRACSLVKKVHPTIAYYIYMMCKNRHYELDGCFENSDKAARSRKSQEENYKKPQENKSQN